MVTPRIGTVDALAGVIHLILDIVALVDSLGGQHEIAGLSVGTDVLGVVTIVIITLPVIAPAVGPGAVTQMGMLGIGIVDALAGVIHVILVRAFVPPLSCETWAGVAPKVVIRVSRAKVHACISML
jgi:hypothetical protein